MGPNTARLVLNYVNETVDQDTSNYINKNVDQDINLAKSPSNTTQLFWAKNAECLCREILDKWLSVDSWTFYCSDMALDIIPETLTNNNIKLLQSVVYRVGKLPLFDRTLLECTAGTKVKFIVFFSPSGVRYSEGAALRGCLSPDTVLVAFGKSTGRVVQEVYRDEFTVRVCSEPTPNGVLDAILAE